MREEGIEDVFIERESKLWFGKYGGCFIADAFTLGCDRYYDAYCKAVADPEFIPMYEQLKKQFADESFKFVKTEKKNLTLCFAPENIYSILGTALLAKKLDKKKAVCGVRYADEAICCARVCAELGVPLKLYLARDIAGISSMLTRLTALGAEYDAKICTELFNLPEMYAFQEWIAEPDALGIINCRSNAGAFPQVNIATDFSKEYGEKFKELLDKECGGGYDRIVVPSVSGSFALAVFKAFSGSGKKLTSVECDSSDDLSEELDSYCGTFTKIMRNRYVDRVLAPELMDMVDERKVERVVVGFDKAMKTSDPKGTTDAASVQSLAALCHSESLEEQEKIICVVRGMRWGAEL